MKKALFIVCGVLLIVSCGYKEGVIQRADRSYLSFTGNLDNVSVQLDNAEPFTLQSYGVDSDGQRRHMNVNNKLYQVSPGKHTIKVYRDGQLVVNRILLLDTDVIKEVHIP